jgi:hypothetical protein
MNRLDTDIWVCRSNIDRFRSMESEAADSDRRALIAALLAREEEKLRELTGAQEARSRLLYRLGDRAVLGVFKALLDDSIAIVGAEAGDIRLADPASDDLRMVVSRGLPASLLGLLSHIDGSEAGLSGKVLASGVAILVDDIAQNPVHGGAMRESGFVSVQSVPFARSRQASVRRPVDPLAPRGAPRCRAADAARPAHRPGAGRAWRPVRRI